MSDSYHTTVSVPRKLLVRIYRCLDWVVGEGLTPWPQDAALEPDDLYLELGAIINPEGKDAREID